MAKSKYSSGQKKAYYSGMGYAAGRNKKNIVFKNADNRESFRQGYSKGTTIIKIYPNKYPDLKK